MHVNWTLIFSGPITITAVDSLTAVMIMVVSNQSRLVKPTAFQSLLSGVLDLSLVYHAWKMRISADVDAPVAIQVVPNVVSNANTSVSRVVMSTLSKLLLMPSNVINHCRSTPVRLFPLIVIITIKNEKKTNNTHISPESLLCSMPCIHVIWVLFKIPLRFMWCRDVVICHTVCRQYTQSNHR